MKSIKVPKNSCRLLLSSKSRYILPRTSIYTNTAYYSTANNGAKASQGHRLDSDPSTDGEAGDPFEILHQDHARMTDIFENKILRATDAQQKRDNVRLFIKEVAMHSGVEEKVVYPAMAYLLDNGKQEWDHQVAEHQDVKNKLQAVWDSEDMASSKSIQLLQLVLNDLKEHNGREETELFPAMRSKMTENQLKIMAQVIKVGKLGAPTRPHPEAPAKPPFNLFVAPVAAVMDRLRDAFNVKGELPFGQKDVDEELSKGKK